MAELVTISPTKVGIFLGRDGKTMTRIEKLFDVEVERIDENIAEGRVTIRGQREDRRRAQEYIKSLCDPMASVVVSFPAPALSELIGRNGTNHQWLEAQSCAVIVFRDGNMADIRGSPTAINVARRLIEDQVRRHVERHSADDANDDTIDRRRPDRKSPPTTRRSNVDYATCIAFAKRLGYSEADAMRVIERLGPDAGRDAVLAALLQCARGGSSPLTIDDVDATTTTTTTSNNSTKRTADSLQLRPVIVDGSNVAMRHGNNKVFSCRGIGLCVDYFIRRGHEKITVFVPSWRKEKPSGENRIDNQEVLNALERDGYLVFTPSRKIQGKRVVCYDDRFIVRLAAESGGVIVSNDTYRDLIEESPEWKEVIERRLLMYTFAGDYFMPPDDPLGRGGPNLNDFLRVGSGLGSTIMYESRGGGGGGISGSGALKKIPCPYGKKCTYGSKCKYSHPEKQVPPPLMSLTTKENASSYGTKITTTSSSSAAADPVPTFVPETGGGGVSSYVPPGVDRTTSYESSRESAVAMQSMAGSQERDYYAREKLVPRGPQSPSDYPALTGHPSYHHPLSYEPPSQPYYQGSPYMRRAPPPVRFSDQGQTSFRHQYMSRDPFSQPRVYPTSQPPPQQHYSSSTSSSPRYETSGYSYHPQPHHPPPPPPHHHPHHRQFADLDPRSERLVREAAGLMPGMESQFRSLMIQRPYIDSVNHLIDLALEGSSGP